MPGPFLDNEWSVTLKLEMLAERWGFLVVELAEQ